MNPVFEQPCRGEATEDSNFPRATALRNIIRPSRARLPLTIRKKAPAKKGLAGESGCEEGGHEEGLKGDKTFHRDRINRQVLAHGFTGVAMIAIDDELSALRVKRV